MMLMLFVVHCTWVTSNAYSSPSIVLASYSGDGYEFNLVINLFYYLINFYKFSDRESFWMTFVRLTIGCPKTLKTTHVSCRGGTTGALNSSNVEKNPHFILI